MEQGASEKPIGAPTYRVLWHPEIKHDFSKIPQKLSESILEAAEHRLSRAPLLIGQPLKGTANLLWRIGFSKYRIVYTLNVKVREVWVLSVQKRDIVYRDKHVQSLLRLAVSLQKEIENG